MNDEARRLVDLTAERFRQEYGIVPEAVGVAPGRVNLIGEHTDYSGGYVLPAAIPFYTVVAVAGGRTPANRVFSTTFGRTTFPAEGICRRGTFDDYIAGAVREAGLEGRPLDLLVHGTLPPQAGLSSSASLLVAALAAFAELRGEAWVPLEVALAARRVENGFIGVPCGFMDQFAVACGREDRALLLDCRDNRFVEVPAVVAGHRWLVVYSGVRRELASGGYKVRVEALKQAVDAVVRETGLAADFLRYRSQADIEELAGRAALSPHDADLMRHVCAENARVHAMRHALENGDARAVGILLQLGHRSLSRLFGVSTPQLDALVGFASSVQGVLGMRLTGAGMGGSLVALVEEAAASSVAERILAFVRGNLSPDGDVHPIERFSGGVETWKP
jgi:galactokinase